MTMVLVTLEMNFESVDYVNIIAISSVSLCRLIHYSEAENSTFRKKFVSNRSILVKMIWLPPSSVALGQVCCFHGDSYRTWWARYSTVDVCYHALLSKFRP